MGVLYVVATPIGNLQDITPRAVETLREVDLIAAEDTRHSGRLLKAFDISTPMISYHKHNRSGRERQLLELLRDRNIALISDAGTPAVADPGVELVAAAIEAGHKVVPIPGASSLLAAISASGLVAGPFIFLGFLPRVAQDRRLLHGKAAVSAMPIVLFESPLRLRETLIELAELLGDRRATVARELTKLHEEMLHGTLLELSQRFNDGPPKGEIVIVVGEPAAGSRALDDAEGVVRWLLADGLRPSKAAREVSAILDIPGAEAYDLVRRLSFEKD